MTSIFNKKAVLISLLLIGIASPVKSQSTPRQEIKPPTVTREFRAAWIATVANIDFPSKPGLTTKEQKAELIALLDKAAEMNLNAVVFQIRPISDSLYASPYEPWSEFLTGENSYLHPTKELPNPQSPITQYCINPFPQPYSFNDEE
jgi:uncharacterized lipoprotein YddW (UPF0748 family)